MPLIEAPRRLRTLLVLLFVLLQTVLGACAWAGPPTTIRVGVFHTPPLVDCDRAARPRGIYIDILEPLATARGWTLEYVKGTFEEGQARLAAGEIDLLPNVALTPQRQQVFAYGREPVLHTWGQIFAREDSGIRSLLDLTGKRVVGLRATVQQAFFDHAAASFGVRTQVRALPDYEHAFAEVAAERADAVLANPYTGAVLAPKYGLADTSIMFEPYTLYFVTSKQRPLPELLAAIDSHLQALKADPTSVYFRSLHQLTDTQRKTTVPAWVFWCVPGIGVLALTAIAWSVALRRGARRLRLGELRQRQLAEELSRIFDNSLDMIGVLDDSFRVIRVNAASEKMLGHPAAAIAGRPALDFLPREDQALARRVLERVRRGKPFESCELRVVRGDGSLVPMVWSAVWSQSQQEMYCIGRDDSERRKLIACLKKRGQQLQLANTELQTFSRSVSHDLRSPVAAITGFVGKVVRDTALSRQLSERHVSLLTRSLAAAQRMDQLIEDLLRLARLSEHGVERQPCDLAEIASQVAESLAADRPGCVEFRVEGDLRVHGDPRLLRIVLENLLGNAWKFSSRARAPRVQFGRETLGAQDALFVRDNGVGFDMAYADQLFAPFRRLHAACDYEGTGIGLSIVHKIIARHGGRVWADGAVDAGAVFRFTLGECALPADQAAPAHALPTA